MNPSRRRKFIAGYFAFALAALFLVSTGLISDWGRWYSFNAAYEQQVDSFLNGSFALETQAVKEKRMDDALVWDLVWTKGGIQQPWGLGVPFFHLVFGAGAKLLGRVAYPDRIVLGVALMMVIYSIFRSFYLSSTEDSENLTSEKLITKTIMALVILLLFPPFVALCRSHFSIYEEAEAYAYLTGIALFLATLSFLKTPTWKKFIILCVFSGLVPFVRPTLLFYGAATMLVALILSWRISWPKWKLAVGITLFCAGGGLLFLTNQIRFGSGFEFGHRLNLNHIDAMRYASRFDHPYRTEPFFSATRELISLMFFSKGDLNGNDWYKENFFEGQSETLRWREMYFSTYGLSYAFLIISGWSLLAVTLWGKWTQKNQNVKAFEVESEPTTSIQFPILMAFWSLVSFVPLYFFYLRFPFIASRYLIDFAPCFAVAILAILFYWESKLTQLSKGPKLLGRLCVSAILVWWGFQIFTQTITRPASATNLYSEIVARKSPSNSAQAYKLPEFYEVGMDLLDFGVPLNGVGWYDSSSGNTKAAVTLFVESPEYIEMEVVPAENTVLSEEDYQIIRAKVGLEFLKLQKMEETREGMKLTFAPPQRKIYQSGLQVVFVAFMTTEELSPEDSRFRLLRVRWNGAEEILPGTL